MNNDERSDTNAQNESESVKPRDLLLDGSSLLAASDLVPRELSAQLAPAVHAPRMKICGIAIALPFWNWRARDHWFEFPETEHEKELIDHAFAQND